MKAMNCKIMLYKINELKLINELNLKMNLTIPTALGPTWGHPAQTVDHTATNMFHTQHLAFLYMCTVGGMLAWLSVRSEVQTCMWPS